MTGPLSIDRDRLWRRLEHSARIGKAGETGLCRLALSDEDRVIRDWFVEQAQSLGCQVRYDSAGNIFARRPGTDPDLPPIAIGSHLDTQPSGGRYDGILGVLAGLEVLQTLTERAISPHHPIEIIDWTNEEGSRFSPAMLGSGVFAGIFTPDYADSRTDKQGRRFDAEVARIGYRGDATPHPVAAYFELHIEQGPVLEAEGLEIGVVTGVQGIRWFDVELIGDCCHAGTTPMALRRDPVPALARLIDAVYEIGNSDPGRSLSTVGIIEAQPGSRNTVPGAIRLTVDLRHPDDTALDDMEQRLLSLAGSDCTIARIWRSAPVQFDHRAVRSVRSSAKKLGFSHRDIVSGAGHDAVHVASVAPTAMIFVPCENGISHNPRESITPEQAENGANVLLHAVLDYDGGTAR
jgi:N-carbamoyl-L-amino-acid hydrolase